MYLNYMILTLAYIIWPKNVFWWQELTLKKSVKIERSMLMCAIKLE